MNTLRLEVRRSNEHALITRDRMRVDVTAEFYVRVKPTEDAIGDAAEISGLKTMKPDVLKQLVEGKFVDALRAVAAEGQHALNESRNILNAEQIEMQIRMTLIEQLPQIIRESVKPMEQIDGIKIIQIESLNGGSSGSEKTATNNSNGGSLAYQLVNSALKYRSQAPLVDSLLSDIGLDVGDINGMSKTLHNNPSTE